MTSFVRDQFETVWPQVFDTNAERGGVVVATAEGLAFRAIPNAARFPRHEFTFDGDAMLACLRQGEIFALVHGHPQGSAHLSARDKDGFAPYAGGQRVELFPRAQIWVFAVESNQRVGRGFVFRDGRFVLHDEVVGSLAG
ncbi:MAG: hypothetical protein R3E66_08800 [bacterium]